MLGFADGWPNFIAITFTNLNAVKKPVLAARRAHVTMLPLVSSASKGILILWVEVVRKTVNVLETPLSVHLLPKKRTAHLATTTRIHALMEHAQVSRDNKMDQSLCIATYTRPLR